MNNDILSIIAKVEENGKLDYAECGRLYRYWALGQRLCERLPEKCFSVEREVFFDNAPEEVTERFKSVAKKMRVDKEVLNTLVLSRIYGQAVLFINSSKSALSEPISKKAIQQGDFIFQSCDPMAGVVSINQDPSSVDFLRATSLTIGGKGVSPQRATISYNGQPMYLQYTGSNFTYGGRSVFENMIPIIRAWAENLQAMGRIGKRASSFFAFLRNLKKGGMSVQSAQASLEIVKSVGDVGAVALSSEDRIEAPTTGGIGDLDTLMARIEKEVAIASDTPLSVLLDERLANGFGNGTEDFKAIVQDLNSYREKVIRPLYDFADPFILWKAFDRPFCEGLIKDNPDRYMGYSVEQLQNELTEGFSFDFGNLSPSTKLEEVEVLANKLTLAERGVAIGLTTADAEDYINREAIFGCDVTIAPREDNGEEEVEF